MKVIHVETKLRFSGCIEPCVAGNKSVRAGD